LRVGLFAFNTAYTYLSYDMYNNDSVSLKIKSWAEADRPREKLLLKGKAVLSDAELIGILIASGTRDKSAVELAKEILSSVGNSLNSLAKLTVKDLMKFKGIGEAKAITIVGALELGRRKKNTESEKKAIIKCSEDAYNVIRPHLEDLKHEEFWILILNRRNQVLKKQHISSGGVSGTVADPKIIFHAALQELASSVLLVHNHPSGNRKPSQADINLTKNLKKAGEVLEIPVVDHIIYTDDGYSSFADDGLL
jgi:DNA repair protein RadC